MNPTTKSLPLEDLVELARAGNRAALETVIERVQDKIYGLVLRMLWHPEDARDATQEILIGVITHLGGFRRESAFMTWTYRIAANYLSSVRKSRLEEQRYTFERFGRELDEGLSELSSSPVNQAEQAVLLQEESAARWGCCSVWTVHIGWHISWARFWNSTTVRPPMYSESRRPPFDSASCAHVAQS